MLKILIGMELHSMQSGYMGLCEGLGSPVENKIISGRIHCVDGRAYMRIKDEGIKMRGREMLCQNMVAGGGAYWVPDFHLEKRLNKEKCKTCVEGM